MAAASGGYHETNNCVTRSTILDPLVSVEGSYCVEVGAQFEIEMRAHADNTQL